jgi:hypothetical protein
MTTMASKTKKTIKNDLSDGFDLTTIKNTNCENHVLI